MPRNEESFRRSYQLDDDALVVWHCITMVARGLRMVLSVASATYVRSQTMKPTSAIAKTAYHGKDFSRTS